MIAFNSIRSSNRERHQVLNSPRKPFFEIKKFGKHQKPYTKTIKTSKKSRSVPYTKKNKLILPTFYSFIDFEPADQNAD